jgi:hypothetical protein
MASAVKFQQFAYDLSTKKHDLNGDDIYCGLSNVAPTASSNQVWGDITEISAGNGYTAGGSDSGNTGAGSGGTYTVTCTNITWTCSGSNMATFRYVVAYNHTQTSPVKPLILYWDYGSGLTLTPGDSFTIQFNGGGSSGTLLTVA